MRRISLTVLVTVLALGLMAGAALAAPPEHANKGGTGNGQPGVADRGNSLASQAQPVELDPGDVTFEQVNGQEYIRVQHDIGAWETLVQREPARYQHNVVTGPGNFNAAWLGILDSEGTPVEHKGQLTWYYELAEQEWVSLNFQFNGKGELLHVNGVSPQ